MDRSIRNAWPLVKQQWSECQVSFDCICGKNEGLFIEDDPVTCDECGRVYRLSTTFTVEEPPHANGA
jgi:hypothetical protein